MAKVEEKSQKIIGVILAYNCATMLPRAVKRIPKNVLDEVIVFDDGSTDNTFGVAKKLKLKVFRHYPNRGYGGNLKVAIQKSLEMGADYIVEIHGDGAQFNPASIKYTIPYINKGFQLILGSRFQESNKALKNGMPLLRFIANRFLSFFDKLILRLPLTEFHTGFRIYGREFLEAVPYTKNSDDYLFSFQIIAQAAYAKIPVAEVPVDADYKNEHTSHSLGGASLYAVQTFLILSQFILAKSGIYTNKIFNVKKHVL